MNVLETLQRIAATTERLDQAIREVDRERSERQQFQSEVNARFETVTITVAELRERLARLEAGRDADRSQAAAEIARFKAEAERALSRRLPTPDPHEGAE